jgi:membrane protein YdbS with pleckstrin-like domain
MAKLDENYFKTNSSDIQTIEEMVGPDEQILWRGKPKKRAYLINAFTKMLPIALIWLIFDGGFIGLMIGTMDEIPAPVKIFMAVFFLFHLAPVWIWLSHVLTANRQHENLEYAFTNKRIIIKSGIIGIDFKNIYYSEIDSVNLRVGLVDRIEKVGDIYIKSIGGANVLYDLENPYSLTEKLQKIVVDIKTDIQFPNNLRPAENDGYSTKYTYRD